MKLTFSATATLAAFIVAISFTNLTSALLVQPYNYLLDDSGLVNQADGGSLSPFNNDHSEQAADKDIVGIIGDRLARLRYARMLDNQDESAQSHFSQEMAELIQQEQAAAASKDGSSSGSEQSVAQSLPVSVASMLLNVAQAAAQASAADEVSAEANQQQQHHHQQQSGGAGQEVSMSSRGNIMELDTTANAHSQAAVSKADLKQQSGSSQWFNPKETIPVLKISSMATPSKYKKVYFRSEKKLVDGAFHSPSTEQEESGKKSLMKPFSANVQRRSSRGTASSAPPGMLQDGVIDFLKKFRDVYIQTRPVGSGSSPANFAASMVAAAASSPFAAFMAPSSTSGSRPNLANALSAASSMVAQAASSSVPTSGSSGVAGAASGPAAAAAANAAGALAGAATSNRPLTAQSYVSFWSKTFPTWVRKMLKQLRRRSLHSSSKRQQHQHHHHSASNSIGQAAQAAASSAIANAVDQATGGSGSGNSPSSSSSHSSSH